MSLTRTPRVSYQASATRRSQHRVADLRARLAGAGDLPVSADFENGLGDEAEYVAETIRLAADAGLVGCTIENAMKDKDNLIYPFEAAVARIEATAAAADAFGFAFHLTGRCELLAGECGSGRYNPPIESVRRCGRKGSYRTRTSRPKGGEDRLQGAFHTVQFHSGYSGPVLRYRVTASVWRPAYRFGDGDLS